MAENKETNNRNIKKLSIVIPVYNADRYLEDCLSSIINQLPSDCEIVVVDDGSVDNSLKIANKHQSQNIKVVHQKNMGVSHARLNGAKYAEGKYLWFVDADDFIEPDSLNYILKLIDKYKSDIFVYAYSFFDNKNNTKKIIPFHKFGHFDEGDIYKDIYPCLIQTKKGTCFSRSLCNKIIKKEIFLKNPLAHKDATIGEDHANVVAAVLNSKSIFIDNKNIYLYRYNPSSATKKHEPFNKEYPIVINGYIKRLTFNNEYDFSDQIEHKIIHDLFNMCYSQFYADESFVKISKIIKKECKKDFYKGALAKKIHFSSYKLILCQVCLVGNISILLKLYSIMMSHKRKS